MPLHSSQLYLFALLTKSWTTFCALKLTSTSHCWFLKSRIICLVSLFCQHRRQLQIIKWAANSKIRRVLCFNILIEFETASRLFKSFGYFIVFFIGYKISGRANLFVDMVPVSKILFWCNRLCSRGTYFAANTFFFHLVYT